MVKIRCKLREVSPGVQEGECEVLSDGGRLLGKVKRAPSKYNLFIGSCVKSKTGKIQDRFKACAGEYQRQKGR